jgi:hypothetical protein
VVEYDGAWKIYLGFYRIDSCLPACSDVVQGKGYSGKEHEVRIPAIIRNEDRQAFRVVETWSDIIFLGKLKIR